MCPDDLEREGQVAAREGGQQEHRQRFSPGFVAASAQPKAGGGPHRQYQRDGQRAAKHEDQNRAEEMDAAEREIDDHEYCQ